MRRKFNVRQRNYIILGLCSILLVMAAGYAAFRSQLTINGTSNITSDWKVLITDIQSNVLSGDATDAKTPTHTETTATFKTNLVSPGDSMQYDITVENRGDIDAVLESIDVKTSENEAILFETSGIKRGDKLLPEESDVLTVVVTYNPEVTNQPDNLNSEVTVTLNYVQDDGTILPEPEGASIGGISVPTVESGDGLYEDSTRAGRYVYKGANPNNYIEFNNELWRIVAKEADGAYKIVRNEVLPEDMPFDERGNRDSNSNGAGGTYCANSSNGCNAWAANANLVGSPSEFTNATYTGTVLLDSSLNTYLNGEYLESITDNSDKIINYNWGVGATYTDASWEDDDIDPSEFVAEEAAYKWNGKVALLSPSDVHLSVSNEELCGTDNKYYDNLETCASNNYLVIPGTSWWLVSPDFNYSYYVSVVASDGYLGNDYRAYYSYGVRPAVYLTSSLSLSGSGTQSDPYIIVS